MKRRQSNYAERSNFQPNRRKLVQLPGQHFFDTLRQKLNWGLDRIVGIKIQFDWTSETLVDTWQSK